MVLSILVFFIFFAMFLGAPIALVFALASFFLCSYYGIGITGALLAAYDRASMYVMIALPLFILLGSLMSRGGLARKLVDFVGALFGSRKGGMGDVLVITNTIFGAICGVASSALATIGGIMIPEMEKRGYPRGYSTGLSVSSCILSLLIPPSTSMIIYGMAAKVSIPLLFLSTIVPGLLLTVLLIVINNICVKKIPGIIVSPKVSFSEKTKSVTKATRTAIPVLILPFIILGGIYGGVFTPTEAASIAVVYVLLYGIFFSKEMNIKVIWDSIIDTGRTTGAIVIVFFFFFVLSRILILLGAPDLLMNFLFKLTDNRIILLLILNLILVITGMFMDDVSGLILAAIIYLPVAQKLGLTPVQFGAICGVNLGMGLITPPVAPILYMGGIVGKVKLEEYYKVTFLSMLFAYIPVIILATYVPAVTLTLPNWFLSIIK